MNPIARAPVQSPTQTRSRSSRGTILERYYSLWLVLVWIGCAVAAIGLSWGSIVGFRFPDADDVMRLLEVRDWIGGQAWFDVSQHRMNLPQGLSMHWSRLLDVPLAALIAFFTPLVGQRAAETIAAVTVPMLTLGAAMALVAGITRRRTNAAGALLGAGFCILSVGAWYAMRPLRIDHHGWQVVAGLAMVSALLSGRRMRGALLAGLCAGTWTHISLEGLVCTGGAAAWLGVRWIATPADERLRLPAFLGGTTITILALRLITHGAASIGTTFCDQASLIHLAALALATAASLFAVRLAPASLLARAGLLGAAALASLLVYKLGAPQCAGGPFALGPLGRKLWYYNIYEGIPLWRIPVPLALLWGLFPWVGVAGALLDLKAGSPDRKQAIDYLALLCIATVAGMFVTRTGAFTNLLAIPGAVGLILQALQRTAGWTPAARILARTLALLLLSPDCAALAALLATSIQPASKDPLDDPRCGTIDALAPLDSLPPGTILTPLGMGPALIAATHHTTVTGPYHRNPEALEDVLAFFTQDDARAVAVRRHVRHVAFCMSDGEMRAMAKFAPRGLAAALVHGQPPLWLQPETLPGTAGLRLYRVIP